MPLAVHILILAAGASLRMRGQDKLLQPIAGIPILRRVAGTAEATGCPLWVTLPPEAKARYLALDGLGVGIVEVPDHHQGMSRSLVRGVTAIASAGAGPQDGLMVLPADMPEFTVASLGELAARFQGEPWLIRRGGTADGKSGHPAIFPRDLWPELAAVTGDEGGRSVLLAHRDRVRVTALPGRMAVLDLDTPEDWAAYLGRTAPSA